MSKILENELWREDEKDPNSPSISCTEENEIAIRVGNTVIIRDIQTWHQLAKDEIYQNAKQGVGSYEPSKLDKVGQYLHLLFEAQRSNHDVHKEIDEALKQFRIEIGL